MVKGLVIQYYIFYYLYGCLKYVSVYIQKLVQQLIGSWEKQELIVNGYSFKVKEEF